MTLLCELQVAEFLNHPFFNGDNLSDTAKKKRIRKLARQSGVRPVLQRQEIWLFHENDIEKLLRCRSNLKTEKVHPIGKSPARTAGSAFEKARRLTTAK